MPFEYKFPDVGEGIQEGEIVRWLVKEGDLVKEDQNIVQIETDKAVVDIPSPKTGKILKINFKEGDVIKVGEVLVVIGEEGEVSIKKTTKPKGKYTSSVVGQLEEAPEEQELQVPHSTSMQGSKQKILASPAVRKLALENRIDLTKIKASGPNGQILKSDIENPSEKQEVPQQKITVKRKYDEFGYIERIPLKGIRKTIATNMIKSQTEAAQVTAMEDINVSKLWKLRNKEKVRLAKEVKLTFLPYIIKATISALKENPILNSSLENEEIIIKKYFNIGIAVETEVGLMVPVIKIAENKNIVRLAKEILNLSEKAKTRKIDIMDLKGSTFTITNYGSIGGTYATPIINPGEAAILGLGRIFDRVIVGGTAKILPISLTFDHRILDGAQAARFIESLKSFLEDPEGKV
ncbi:MAG: branched-chain alpha-keto acid dehydrogenase subunit E2 [Nanoarchaeota archaeon]|nr:branched-chain alpha-keto acid dehydrogenase subunit E2 [Nanoarchaeota archaeon]|tara:strand:+ start:221 stop:1441 length:1221 start_codon:yes stop_codon:yes gene_type:complete